MEEKNVVIYIKTTDIIVPGLILAQSIGRGKLQR